MLIIFLRRPAELSLNTRVSGVIPKFLLMKPPESTRCTRAKRVGERDLSLEKY